MTKTMNTPFSICIGRQLGSGGHQIGQLLAQQLNFSFFDKELIDLASRESGLEKKLFEQADEKASHSLFAGLLGLRNSFDEYYFNDYLGYETLFRIQSQVIQKLAQSKSCVFVGRCADYILREKNNSISLFICASHKDRFQRIQQRMNGDREAALALMTKADKKRANYYNYYTDKSWGEAASYDLCINSSLLGIDETTKLIARIVEKRKERESPTQ